MLVEGEEFGVVGLEGGGLGVGVGVGVGELGGEVGQFLLAEVDLLAQLGDLLQLGQVERVLGGRGVTGE